ncbi:MAG: phage tail tape measure protein [Bacteroides sp.]|nr:phage tail tape measure protein [Bacteroides sp.]
MASNNDLNRSIKITIDGTDAAKGIQKVKEEIASLNKQLANLQETDENYSKNKKELDAAIKRSEETLGTYEKKVKETERVLKNLSGATYNELLAVKRQLQDSLKREVRGTEKYNETLRQYKRVTEEATKAQKDMRVEVGCQGTTLGKLANGFNKYIGLITSGIAGITGLSVAMRKSVDDYAKMQEAMAGVKKYTGLADNEIKDLNEDLKKMDTRTSREKLNALAGDAGRLGIQSKEAILEFVDAADKINVALGEDLGEDAVKNIGKLAQMFGEDERLGLRGAMLATGSAINEVAQNSAAAEPFLVDFAARVAGAANQAGISQDKIIGFAAAMDENMLREETSATAYQKILLKLFTDTEKFAEAAGMDVQEFAALVRTDANEALLQFAEALGQKGGLADLAPIFGDLKTEGAGVSTVLSVLAGKADEIREHQALANKAYAEGVSIQKEFEVQNNTVQAGLDKAKKGFHEVSIALGEKLQPLMKHFISGTGLLVRGLNTLLSFCIRYAGELISLTIIVGAYTAAVKLQTLWEIKLRDAKVASLAMTKLQVLWNNTLKGSYLLLAAATLALTGNITRATAAMKLFNMVTKLNPWGVVLSILTAVGVAIFKFTSRTNEGRKAMESFTAQCISEQKELRKTYDAILATNEGTQARRDLIKEFNDKYGDYLGYMLSEKSTLDDLKTAYEQVTIAMQSKIAQQVLSEKTDAIERDAIEEKSKQMEKVRELLSQYLTDGQLAKTMPAIIQNVDQLVAKGHDAEVVSHSITKMLQNLYSQLNYRGARNGLIEYLEDYAETAIDTADKIDDVKSRLMPFIKQPDKKKSNELPEVVITPGTTTTTPSPSSGEESTGKGETPTEKALREEKELHQRYLYELKQEYANQEGEILMTKEEYADAQEQLVMMHLQRSLDIVGLDAQQKMDIEQQLLDFKIKCVDEELANRKRAADEQAKIEEQNRKKLEDIGRKRYQTMMGYAETFSSGIANAIANEQNVLEAFGDSMVDIVFDVVEQLIDAELIRLTGIGLSTIAEVQARQIGSKGFAGIASGLALAAVISASLAAAKAGLKALLKGGKKSSDGGTEAKSYKRVATGVNQYASGKYDVIGGSDGRLYSGVPYIGAAPTGIVRSPALISEHGAELIINAEDLARLQQHVNYPLVLQAIADSRRGTAVPQHEAGSYPVPVSPSRETTGNSVSMDTLRRLAEAIEYLNENGVAATTVLSEFEKKQALRDRARKIGSKKR